MIRLLQVGGWITAGLLLLTVLMGVAAALGMSAPLAHLPLGLGATLATLLHQSLFLFYYVGISTTLTGVLRRERLPAAIGSRIPRLRRVVPLSVATLAGAIAAFTLGGGAHTGEVSPHVHGVFAFVALGSASGAAWFGGRALGEVGAAIAAIEARLAGR